MDGFGSSFGKNPGVLAASTLRRVDDQGSLLESDPCEPSRLNVDVAPIEHVGTQVDVAALEVVVDDGRHAGQGQRGLGDVTARVLLDLLGEFASLCPGGVGPDQHSVTSR